MKCTKHEQHDCMTCRALAAEKALAEARAELERLRGQEPVAYMDSRYGLCWYKDRKPSPETMLYTEPKPPTGSECVPVVARRVCGNCDTALPEDCGGVFKSGGSACWLNTDTTALPDCKGESK